MQGLLRLMCLVIVCMFTAGATSCSTDGESVGPTFVTDLTIKNAAGAITQSFTPGEPITFELSVRNRTRSEAILQFPSTHQSDFVVIDSASRVRWLWSRDRAFPAVITELEFAPEETKTSSFVWDQVGDGGLPLSPGNYEARGVLVFAEFAVDPLAPHQLGSPLRPFTIR